MIMWHILSLSLVFVMMLTIFVAYTNDMSVLITINEYGEGLIEVLFLPALFGFGVYNLHNYVKKEVIT